MHVQDAIEEYRYAILVHARSTQDWYLARLKQFAAWCEQEQLQLEHIKTRDIRQYIEFTRTRVSEATGKTLSSYTVNGHARAVRAFLTWCSKEDGLDSLVAKKTPEHIGMPKIDTKVIETLSQGQIKALFAACDQEFTPTLVARDRAVLSLLLDTGLRASELCGLTLEDCHIQPEDAYLKVFGKGHKERELGLGKAARTALHRYITRYRKAPKEEQHVFLSRFAKPLTVNGLDQILYRLAEWAHITDTRVSAHVWRHTYACNYLINGGDLYKLSRLLGHTSTSVTENYLRAVKNRDARNGRSVLDDL